MTTSQRVSQWSGRGRKSKRDSCVISYFIPSPRACCPSLINSIKVLYALNQSANPRTESYQPKQDRTRYEFLVFHRLRVKHDPISVIAESFIGGDSSFKVAVGDL